MVPSSAMASPLIKTVLEESRISPPPGSVPESSVRLTSFDIPWLHASPVHRLFFYSSPLPAAPFIESLKSSLSLTLQHYYTLAGTVRLPLESSDKIINLHYSDGNAVGIPFTVAESDADFNELSSGGKRDYFTQVLPLVPQLHDTAALLAVQVTVFPGHGICLSITVHHVAGDGSSTVGFLKSWASACKYGTHIATHTYDRSYIIETPGVYEAMFDLLFEIKATPSSEAEEAKPTKEVTFATYKLRKDQIDRFKRQFEARNEPNIHSSTFIVSCAYTWVCLVKARGGASDQTAHFAFAVDCRSRLDPPVPASYFGNCLKPAFVEEKIGVLMGEDGVVAAALAIARTVAGLKDGVLLDVNDWGSKLRAVINKNPLSVAGSPKLGVYDIEFGWGKPMRVEVPSIQKSGAMSLAETREGDGGIEIGFALEKVEMNEFEKHFYDGLE